MTTGILNSLFSPLVPSCVLILTIAWLFFEYWNWICLGLHRLAPATPHHYAICTIQRLCTSVTSGTVTDGEVEVCAVLCLCQLYFASCVSRADSAMLPLLLDLLHMGQRHLSVAVNIYLVLVMCHPHHINACGCYWPARVLYLFFPLSSFPLPCSIGRWMFRSATWYSLILSQSMHISFLYFFCPGTGVSSARQII